MGRWDKFRQTLLSGQSDNNIDFADLCGYLNLLGFTLRPSHKSSHHIYTKEGIQEIINLQPTGHLAQPYQVRQVRLIIDKYGL